MKNIIKKIWNILTIIGLIVIVIWFIKQPSDHQICRNYYRKAKNYSYNGIVIKKYIDTENHSHKTIKLLRSGDTLTRIFTEDISGFYEYVQIGDNISKKEGSYDIKLFTGREDTIFTLDYGCDSID
jgi:hypothetical protein